MNLPERDIGGRDDWGCESRAAWHEEIEEHSTRDERVYYAQNWRGDVSALLTDTGSMIEWVKYSAYGVPYSLPAGDTNSDGSWNAADEGRIGDAIGVFYDVRYDTMLTGEVTDHDITHANSIAGGYQTLARGVQSSPAVANRVGYAGYRYDPTFKGASRTIYHVRHRVYDADVGRWTRRDPLGYVDGMSLYEYVRSRPVRMVDPRGTDAAVGGGQPGNGGGPAHGCTNRPTYGECIACCRDVGGIGFFQCEDDCYNAWLQILVPPDKPPLDVSPDPSQPPFPPAIINVPSFQDCIPQGHRCMQADTRADCQNCCEQLDDQARSCMAILWEYLIRECRRHNHPRCADWVWDDYHKHLDRLPDIRRRCLSQCDVPFIVPPENIFADRLAAE